MGSSTACLLCLLRGPAGRGGEQTLGRRRRWRSAGTHPPAPLPSPLVQCSNLTRAGRQCDKVYPEVCVRCTTGYRPAGELGRCKKAAQVGAGRGAVRAAGLRGGWAWGGTAARSGGARATTPLPPLDASRPHAPTRPPAHPPAHPPPAEARLPVEQPRLRRLRPRQPLLLRRLVRRVSGSSVVRI